MADERCVYENVLRDAMNLCVEIFVKWLAILTETSNQRAILLFPTVVQLFEWIAIESEWHVRYSRSLRVAIADVIKNRACEHGARYKVLIGVDAFWDEKRLQILKDARRATRHHHLPVEGVAPILDELKNAIRKQVKEERE